LLLPHLLLLPHPSHKKTGDLGQPPEDEAALVLLLPLLLLSLFVPDLVRVTAAVARCSGPPGQVSLLLPQQEAAGQLPAGHASPQTVGALGASHVGEAKNITDVTMMSQRVNASAFALLAICVSE
jgi:hypothetical protein